MEPPLAGGCENRLKSRAARGFAGHLDATRRALRQAAYSSVKTTQKLQLSQTAKMSDFEDEMECR